MKPCDLLIAALIVLACPAARGADHFLDIRPAADASWGGAIQDVEKVLRSAADELWPYFPDRSLKPILVEPKGGPIILFHRGPQGEYLVRLNTGDRLWAQHAYQFAHEFAHILANYDKHEQVNKWFEESICETASIFVLRRMSATWKVRPPYPNWKEYSSSLSEYAEQRIQAGRLPPGKTFAQWFRENEPQMRADPCLRDKNTVVAADLLGLLEKQPENWQAITWLNDGQPHGSRALATYLADWRNRAPAKFRQFIEQAVREFGLSNARN